MQVGKLIPKIFTIILSNVFMSFLVSAQPATLDMTPTLTLEAGSESLEQFSPLLFSRSTYMPSNTINTADYRDLQRTKLNVLSEDLSYYSATALSSLLPSVNSPTLGSIAFESTTDAAFAGWVAINSYNDYSKYINPKGWQIDPQGPGNFVSIPKDGLGSLVEFNYEAATLIQMNDIESKIGLLVVSAEHLSKDAISMTCTASLLPLNRILTNQHCIKGIHRLKDRKGYRVVKAWFLLGIFDASSIRRLNDLNLTPDKRVKLEPISQCLDLSPSIYENCENLDYAIHELSEGIYAQDFGLNLGSTRDPRLDEHLYIIQYPVRTNGIRRGKSIVIKNCRVSEIDLMNTRFKHTCDTQSGSSGALIVAQSDHIPVGLHFAGGKDKDGKRFNWGIKLPLILAHNLKYIAQAN